MNKKYSKLGSNMFWMTVGNFASKVLLFLLVPFYTNYLTTNEYGLADILSTTVSLATPFFTLLIAEGILRFALDKKIDKRQVFSISVSIIAFGTIILVIFSPLLAISKTLKPYIVEFILYYLFSVMVNVFQQFLKGIECLRTFVSSGILNTIVNVGLNILFLYKFKMGVNGYLYAIIIANICTTIFIFMKEKLWKYHIAISKIDKSLFREMITYSLPLIPNSLSWWINNCSDKYILTFFAGTAVNGIYSISYKIPSLITTLSTIFTNAWQISAVEDFGSKESCDFFSDIYRKYSSFNIIITSMVILLNRIIARLLFSKEFYVAWKYAGILIIVSMFQALCAFLGTIYTSSLKTKMIFITTLVGAVINIIFNFILIPRFGAYGAAIATLVSYIVIWMVRLIDSRKIVKMNLNIKRDVFCYILIMIQCIVITLDFSFYLIWNSIIFTILIFVNWHIFGNLFRVFWAIVKR